MKRDDERKRCEQNDSGSTKYFLITHVDQPPFRQLDLYWGYVQ